MSQKLKFAQRAADLRSAANQFKTVAEVPEYAHLAEAAEIVMREAQAMDAVSQRFAKKQKAQE